jgi:hypothetical protein
MLFSAYFAFCERNKIRLMQSPSCRCVCVFKTVCLRIPQTNSECLNQCSWKLLCIARRLSKSQRRAS